MASRNKSYPGIFLVFILTACLSLCAAVSNNNIVTIDDASISSDFYTSPTTSTSIPPNSTSTTDPQWTHENCSSCLSKPDLTAVYGGTYTAVYLPAGNTFQYNVSFEFDGNAIFVYLILSKQAPTICTFILDGEATPYTGSNMTAEFQYNTLAFSQNLPSQPHTLTITAEGQANEANYVNFDYATFTRPSSVLAVVATTTISTKTDTGTPTPSQTSDSHTTLKAIIGGVVGGFIAVVVLIAVAAFYRSRRLREMEEAHPFTRTRDSYEPRAKGLRSRPNEREHLMPYTLPGPTSPHHERGKLSTPAPGATPYDFLLSTRDSRNMDPQDREQRQEGRRLELNNRLETVTAHMRVLKTSYAQGQTRLREETRRQRQPAQREDMIPEVNETTANPSNSDPPPVAVGASHRVDSMTAGGGGFTPPSNPDHPLALMPIRLPQPVPAAVESRSLEWPLVNPYALADMRSQMGIMMDQIQYLRAQQDTPYIRGLTDEPPPGYMDAIGPYHRSP